MPRPTIDDFLDQERLKALAVKDAPLPIDDVKAGALDLTPEPDLRALMDQAVPADADPTAGIADPDFGAWLAADAGLPKGYDQDARFRATDPAVQRAAMEMDDSGWTADGGRRTNDKELFSNKDDGSGLFGAKGRDLNKDEWEVLAYALDAIGANRGKSVRKESQSDKIRGIATGARTKKLAEAHAAQQKADAEDKLRRKQDPNSPESLRMVQAMATSLGVPMTELQGLTAYDLETQPKLFDALQAGHARQAKAEQMAEQQRLRLEAEARKRAEQIEQEKRTGNTAADKMARARAAAGQRIAAEGRKEARDLAREERKDVREQAKNDRKQLEDYKKALVQDGLVGTPAALDKLVEAAAAGKAAHGEVPGIGAAGAIDWLPGSTLQGIAESNLSPEGLAVRNAQKGFQEAFARGQSGAAIGVSEDERFKVLTGQVPLQSEAQFYAALEWMKGWMEDRRVVHAGAYPGAAEALEQNIASERQRKAGGSGTAAKPSIPADDDPGWEAM